MRVTEILTATGLPFAQVAFNNPPDESYAVYSEELIRRGADTKNCLTEHNVTVEVYSYDFFDADAVERMADAIESQTLAYTKYDTAFIHDEGLYCTTFEFAFIEKDRS